ncbi:hypothetical protein GQ43DRAFT_442945 [Delitschia confertaspora ATCC 74209]|uniref:Uncharacterized protein n=1 Tax=Delitschia confertaspora ATCC 74209 TaxID=1513339 RepID=A0A9P4JGC4_9PLEO|nr:hypothetical protein GQ43DRAFT_442945 [Delitschia confertaspora ATCC 74209]
MDLCYKSWGPVVRSLTPRLSPQFLRGTSGSATKIGGHTAPRLRPERLSVTLGLTPSTFQADQGLNTENHQRSPNLSGSSPSGHSLHHHFQLHPHRPRSISGVPALYKVSPVSGGSTHSHRFSTTVPELFTHTAELAAVFLFAFSPFSHLPIFRPFINLIFHSL